MAPLSKFVLTITGGTVDQMGSPGAVLGLSPEAAQNIEAEALELEQVAEGLGEPTGTNAQDGQLVVAEEIALGRVSKNACMSLFINYVGVNLSNRHR